MQPGALKTETGARGVAIPDMMIRAPFALQRNMRTPMQIPLQLATRYPMSMIGVNIRFSNMLVTAILYYSPTACTPWILSFLRLYMAWARHR
jgi:hypothetical protein